MHNKPGSAGGRAKAYRARMAALQRYYSNPALCQYCSSIIEAGTEKVTRVLRRKFCNSSCAVSFNNRRKSLLPTIPQLARRDSCPQCGQSKPLEKTLCFRCSQACPVLDTSAKTELFTSRKNWQSARGSIQAHARAIYIKSGRPLACAVCGYSTHIEVCHLRSVSSFSGTASISGEINAIDNLVALCRNHHWELDHGLLVLMPTEYQCA